MARARFICRTTSTRSGPVRIAAPLWRLVGANNRELGRAPEVPAVESTCCAAVARLQARLSEVSGRVKPAASGAAWRWTVEYDGELLAVSGRTYLRQRECQYSLWQFLAAAEVAAIVTGAGHSGPHLCAQ